MDRKAIEYHVQGLLKAIGEDPEREGLRETPARVAQMLEEVLEGTAYTNHDIARMFGKTFAADDDGDTDSAVSRESATWRLSACNCRRSWARISARSSARRQAPPTWAS